MISLTPKFSTIPTDPLCHLSPFLTNITNAPCFNFNSIGAGTSFALKLPDKTPLYIISGAFIWFSLSVFIRSATLRKGVIITAFLRTFSSSIRHALKKSKAFVSPSRKRIKFCNKSLSL